MIDFNCIKKAVEDRDEFLAIHPEYQYLQDEINDLLKTTGSNPRNRQVALQNVNVEYVV